jgi:hypothetical protein
LAEIAEKLVGIFFFFVYGPPKVPRCRRSFGKVRPLRKDWWESPKIVILTSTTDLNKSSRDLETGATTVPVLSAEATNLFHPKKCDKKEKKAEIIIRPLGKKAFFCSSHLSI